MERHLFNLRIAMQALMSNRLRSTLTALGIIFGVAAVITMLAIGRGAKQEILDQLELVGVNNIVIDSKQQSELKNTDSKEQGNQGKKKESGRKKVSGGMTLYDVDAIETGIPGIRHVSPEVVVECQILRKGIYEDSRLIGVNRAYFEINNFEISTGSNFSDLHLRYGEQVCIIGEAIREKFFGRQNPIGKQLKAGEIWLTVIGVLAPRQVSKEAEENLGLRDFNMDIYTPLKTILLRVNDRSSVKANSSARGFIGQGMAFFRFSGGNSGDGNINQIDRIVIQVEKTADLKSISRILSRMLKRRHNGVEDFEITVPILLLEQQQRAKSVFNLVLGAIAGISLLVGGIGIMNIMLASVMERIREIGIRRALGARKADIIGQFLMEAVLISLTGGIIGIILGVSGALLVSRFTDILTIVSGWSIVLSFFIAFIIGLVFGISPARKAAMQDPIESLRHE